MPTSRPCCRSYIPQRSCICYKGAQGTYQADMQQMEAVLYIAWAEIGQVLDSRTHEESGKEQFPAAHWTCFRSGSEMMKKRALRR